MLSSTIVKVLKLSVLLAVTAAAFAAEDRVVLTTMSEELQRNFQALKQKADPAPYFLSYEITDQESHTAGATLGELNSEGNSHNRYLDVTVRVGDPKLDNFRRVRGEQIRFTSGTPVAIENVPGSLKERIWLERTAYTAPRRSASSASRPISRSRRRTEISQTIFPAKKVTRTPSSPRR